MSRIANRLFSSFRISTRLNLNAVARPSRVALIRRMMSSESHVGHGGSASSDTPWIIGSALVFGPLFLYLVSPSARKGSHGHESYHDERGDKHAQHVPNAPVADDEGTEVSKQEIKESMERAFEADAPKDAQESEEVVAKAETPVEEGSTAKAQSLPESLTDAVLAPESKLNLTPSTPVNVDGVPMTKRPSESTL